MSSLVLVRLTRPQAPGRLTANHLFRADEEMARDQARLEHPDVPEHEKADLRGKNLQHYLEGIRKGRTSTALSTKAASYGRWGKWMICIW